MGEGPARRRDFPALGWVGVEGAELALGVLQGNPSTGVEEVSHTRTVNSLL